MTKLSNGSILLPNFELITGVDRFIHNKNKALDPSENFPHRVIDPESAGYKRLVDSKGKVLARRDPSKLIYEPTPLEVALVSHDPFYKKAVEDEKLAMASSFFPL